MPCLSVLNISTSFGYDIEVDLDFFEFRLSWHFVFAPNLKLTSFSVNGDEKCCYSRCRNFITNAPGSSCMLACHGIVARD